VDVVTRFLATCSPLWYGVATAMDSDAPLMPAVAVGWAVGAMSATAAAAFARIADDHVDGRLMVVGDRLVAVGVA
jgi:hypothetical protein